MHPKLIKANIALFNGARTEARRLLKEYVADVNGASPNGDTGLVLWLTAQAQETREQRMDKLNALLANVPPNDTYARLARAYLDQEAQFTRDVSDEPTPDGTDETPRRGFSPLGVPLWKAAVMAGLGLILGIVIMTVLGPREAAVSQVAGGATATAVVAVGLTETPATTATPLPINRTPLAPETHEAEYPQGILQISAIENNSQRIVTEDDGVPVPTVSGARFVALRLIFECRQGVCDDPPEAQLNLQMGDGVLINPIGDAVVQNERALEAVAQGSTTNGWVVFEVPQSATVAALVITPPVPSGEEPQPVLIAIPEGAA